MNLMEERRHVAVLRRPRRMVVVEDQVRLMKVDFVFPRSIGQIVEPSLLHPRVPWREERLPQSRPPRDDFGGEWYRCTRGGHALRSAKRVPTRKHAPKEGAPAGIGIHLHVDDADACIAASIEAGATLVREATDQFYGERSGTVRDPFGHEWLIGHSIEEVAPEEMQRRYTEMMSSGD